MRGTELSPRIVIKVYRFIPAHAGNSVNEHAGRILYTVHPRACGEQIQRNSERGTISGSSPRMRGTAPGPDHGIAEIRFIPAHAGNRWTDNGRGWKPSVHPRACGEQVAAGGILNGKNGSSPRMRGTATIDTDRNDNTVFIPAHAGNSRSSSLGRIVVPVHPRACGEQWARLIDSASCVGSSPRMRGTGAPSFGLFSGRRFIPAHAGNSSHKIQTGFPQTVHPRACGEQMIAVRFPVAIAGSSPRMRGTERSPGLEDRQDRFIPAHAGNRLCVNGNGDKPTVHPRACGEQSLANSASSSNVGSSPRMRGTGEIVSEFRGRSRFIPAHAGNSRVA